MIQNESTCLLMTQGFSPLGVPNRRSQRTLRNKSFFAASVPTRTEGDNRARSSSLPCRALDVLSAAGGGELSPTPKNSASKSKLATKDPDGHLSSRVCESPNLRFRTGAVPGRGQHFPQTWQVGQPACPFPPIATHAGLGLLWRRLISLAMAVRAKSACFSPSFNTVSIRCKVPFESRAIKHSSKPFRG